MTDMDIIVNEYIDVDGNSPYADWLGSLKDRRAQAKILMRVDKMELGLFGDVQPVGDGLSELRIHYGPGYRVYFAKDGNRIYLLLCGGNKSTQAKDIKKAKAYWNDHSQRNRK